MNRLTKIGCFSFLLLLMGCDSANEEWHAVFRYNEPTGIASLDPAFAKNQSVIWAVHQLYNTLVETDTNLHIQPSIAASWDISPDRTEYRFHLRRDVFFHPNPIFKKGKGRKLIATDIVYSFQRLMAAETASPGAWLFNGKVADINPFEAPNDSTFILRLKQPFSPILGILSAPYCSIVPKEVVTYYGKDFRRHPCGTGPFLFDSWEEGQALILKRNPYYFEKDSEGRSIPYLEAIKVSFNDSRATEFLLFQQGKLDFINDIDPSFKDEVLSKTGKLRKEWSGLVNLYKHDYLNTEYLGILVDSSKSEVRSSPLRTKWIRQAINYGFDRRKLMMYLRNSIGTPAENGFIPAGMPSFDTTLKGYSYDPVRARELIRLAGYDRIKDKGKIRLLTIPIYADLANFISRQLDDIGLEITIEVIPKSLLLEQTAKSEAPFFRASWIADYPEAENYLSVFYGQNPAPPNYTRYKNSDYDSLYVRAMRTTSDSLRYDLYKQMDKMIIEDAVIVPLWYDQVVHLVRPELSGWQPNALNMLEIRRVKKSKPIQ